MEVQTAKSGNEAVDICKSGATFDVVIMDLDMPGMNGIEAIKELRDMGVKSWIVLLTSQLPTDRDVSAMKSVGADDCCWKPLTLPKVISIFDKFIAQLD
ncbi:hypothetical protein CRG98_040890 [Punica granatum]|uniref:Response regulatory domain-containing protein n=1 Tax=Punica granatum TaxID=22663 RepID=A0A2I0I420_PUNGR|nr:hypothetical protein CRG98_040890 [Punica granatum]